MACLYIVEAGIPWGDQDEDDEYSSSDSAQDFDEGGGYSNDNQLHAEASSSKLSGRAQL